MQKLKVQFVGHCIGWSASDLHMSFRQMGHVDSSSSSAAPPAVFAGVAILCWLFIVLQECWPLSLPPYYHNIIIVHHHQRTA
mmetsp:Transcript_24484/g.38446  ORF Transcript_24484/g.38446 Transcript_24484/m.38446 type:complete len:82 (+) Transcript_24484:1317-1562(+)